MRLDPKETGPFTFCPRLANSEVAQRNKASRWGVPFTLPNRPILLLRMGLVVGQDYAHEPLRFNAAALAC
jgi:hypothetical protein